MRKLILLCLVSMSALAQVQTTVPGNTVQGNSTSGYAVPKPITALPFTVPASNITGLVASATTDATNAGNISSGVLPCARMPALTGVMTTIGCAASFASTTGTGAVTLATSPTIISPTMKPPATYGTELALQSTSGSAPIHSFYHATNNELILTTSSASSSGYNVFGVENTATGGFSAMTARGIDTPYGSTAQNANGSYEHFAIGFGTSISVGNRVGLNYLESSRFPGSQNAAFPPTMFAIQQTGGAFQSPTYANVVTTNGSNTITLSAGGNFGSSVNGMHIVEVGDGTWLPAGTTIVSGQGTSTLTLSANATANNGILNVVIGTWTASQYDAVLFRETTGIDFFSWAQGATASLPGNPFMRLDRNHGFVGIGALLSTANPIAALDVVGQAYFGSQTPGNGRTQTYANGVINIEDSGTQGLGWQKVGVNTFRWTWNATPSRLDFVEVNASTIPLSLYMDGTSAIRTGPQVIVGTAFTVTGCGTAAVETGSGASAGAFTVGTGASTCTFVFTIGGATGAASPKRWIANVDDATAGQHCTNSVTANVATVTVLCNFAVTTGDTITFSAIGG